MVAAFLAGALSLLASQGWPSRLSPLNGSFQSIKGVVASDPRISGSRRTFALSLSSVGRGKEEVRLRGRLEVSAPVGLPARGDVLHEGDVITAWGRFIVPGAPTNPGEIPLSLLFAHRGFDAMFRVPNAALLRLLGREPLPWHVRATKAARARVRDLLHETMPGPHGPIYADLLGSILFGSEVGQVPQAVMDLFRRSGTIHILVVSGTQISLLFTLVWLPGALAAFYRRRRAALPAEASRRPPHPGRGALTLGIALTSAYAVLVGGGNPVCRAAIVAVMVAIAIGLAQSRTVAEEHPLETDRYTLLAAAALVLLVQRPTALFDPGFQLSFACILGLSCFTPHIANLLQGLPRWLGTSLAMSVGVQLAVIPIQSWHFGQVSWIGIVANLVAVPLAALLLIFGVTACALGLAWLPAATAINYLNALLLRGLVSATAAMAEIPGASAAYHLASIWYAVAYYVVVAAIVRWAGQWAARAEQANSGP
jgi:competence protein ComEC